jgi:hypothetical protein
MATKNIMRAFKMNEISAVDRPAQAGARMTIMKRDDSEDYWKRTFTSDQRNSLASTGAALPDGSFPIVTRSDLSNAIHAIGRAKDPAKAKAHIIARAKTLGATDTLPDGWVSKSNHGHERIEDMTEAEMKKMLDDAVKTALPAAVTAATADLTKKLNETTAQLVTLQKAGKKKPYDDSATDGEPEPDADDMDDSTKKAWRGYVEKRVTKAVAKAKEAFDAEIAKNADIAKSDETLEHDGVVLRKSVIGEDQFKVMKSLTDTNEINAFTKRADAEIPALPGTSVAKAKALRAVSKLAKEDRDVIEAMLKGGNAAMKTQLTTLGKDGNGDDTADGQLEKLAVTYAAEHKVTKAVAYTKVLETEAGKAAYAKSLTEKRAA